MYQEFLVYDPVRDQQAVDPTGYVDLRYAFVEGTLPADVTAPDISYNGIEDPSAILRKPTDVFDTAHLMETEKLYNSSNSEKDED